MQHPKISACMIVKDEEKVLGRCLASVQDCVDELIVVDTGSGDSTLDIAESYGAKVYHHPWEKNFSKHRNQSIGYARGDWILVIDADEELISGGADDLRELLGGCDSVDGVYVRVENESPSGIMQTNSIRIIKNNGTIHYEGRVHNDLVGVRKTVFSRVRIFHYGYNLGPATDDRKFKRTTELLKLDIEENPRNARAHHFLGVSYMAFGRNEEAVHFADKAIRLFEQNGILLHNYLWSLYVAGGASLNLGALKRARKYAERAVRVFPRYLDAHFILCQVHMMEGNSSLFWKHRTAYLDAVHQIKEKPEQFGQILHNTLPLQWKLLLFAGIVALEKEGTKRADREFNKAFELCPEEYRCRLELARLFRSKKMLERAAQEYEAVLGLVGLDVQPFRELMAVFDEQGEENRGVRFLENQLEGYVKCKKDRLPVLGVLCYKDGHKEVAKRFFEKVLEVDPENAEAHVHLASLRFARSDLTGCADACSELLRILGLDQIARTDSPLGLAGNFIAIAEFLYKHAHFALSKECVRLGQGLATKSRLLQVQ